MYSKVKFLSVLNMREKTATKMMKTFISKERTGVQFDSNRATGFLI